ncbi:UNVERIFIED_CONTAM: hypothetical protein FKN15_010886 [Acipenser sinensis]
MNTRCPPKRVPSAERFFSHCVLTMQPPKSYSVGGQRSSRAAYRQARRRPARLQGLLVRDGLSFGIRNDHLGKCIQLIPGKGRVALAECSPESELQKWDWQASSQSLISLKTKECLTAARAKEHEMVRLQVCREGENQGWSCSKKGHLTLQGLGLHLSTKQGSSKVFLSKERGKTSKWRTMHNGTVCAEAAKPPTWKHEGPTERVQQPTLTLQSESQHCSIAHGQSVIEYSPQ